MLDLLADSFSLIVVIAPTEHNFYATYDVAMFRLSDSRFNLGHRS